MNLPAGFELVSPSIKPPPGFELVGDNQEEGHEATLSNEGENIFNAGMSLATPLLTYPTAIGTAVLNTAAQKTAAFFDPRIPKENAGDIFRRERKISEEKSAEMLKMYEPQEGSIGGKIMKPIGWAFNSLTEIGREVLDTTADMMGLSRDSFLRELMKTGGELAAFEVAAKGVKAGKATVKGAAEGLARGISAKTAEQGNFVPSVTPPEPPVMLRPPVTRVTPKDQLDRLKNEDFRAEEVFGLEARQGIKDAVRLPEGFELQAEVKPPKGFEIVEPVKRGPSPIPQRKIAAEVIPEVKMPEPKLETEIPPAPSDQTIATPGGTTTEAGGIKPRDIYESLKDFGNISEEIELSSSIQSSGAPKGKGQNLVTFIESMGGVNLDKFSDIVSVKGGGGFKKGRTKDLSRELHPDIGTVSNRGSKNTLDTIAQSLEANKWAAPEGGWTDQAVFDALAEGRGRDIMRPDLSPISPKEQAKLDKQEAYYYEGLADKEPTRTAGAVIKDVGETLSGKVGMQIDLGDRIQSRLAAENRLKQDLVRWQAEAKEAGISLEKHLKGMGWGSNTDKLLTLLPAEQQAQARQNPRPTIPRDETGIKVDVIAEERARRGAPEIDKPAWTTQEAWDEGQRLVNNGLIDPRTLAQDIINNPEKYGNLSAEKTNALIYDRQMIKNKYDYWEKKVAESVDAGDAEGERFARIELDKYQELFDKNDEAGMLSGAEWSKAGHARQNMIAEDFSKVALIRRYKVDTGKPLDPNNTKDAAIIAKLTSYSEKIIELQNQVRHFEETKASGAATASMKKLVNEVAREKRQHGRAIAKEVLDNEFSSLAKAAAKAMGSQSALHSGLPTEVVSIIGKMAKNRVESGIITVEGVVDSIVTQLKNIGIDVASRDVMDAISGYGVEKKLSKDKTLVILRDLRGQMQQLAKLEDLQKTGKASRTGMERRTPSDTERELIRKVNEAKKEFGIETTDKATQLKSAQDAIITRLTNSITDVTKEIETGKYEPPKAGVTYNSEAIRLKDFRDKLVELRDAVKATFEEAGIAEPTGKIETPAAAKIAAQKREVTMEQRIAAAVKAAERATGRYQEMANSGDLFPAKKGRSLIETPELADARQLKEDVKAYVQELRDIANPKLTPDQIAEKRYKTLLTKKIAEIEGKLKSGDFTTRDKKVRNLSKEEQDLKFKLDEAMAEYNDARVKWQKENRTNWEKTKGMLAEGANLTRAIKTSFDLSAVLRQGGFIFRAHPIRGIKSIPDMIEALKSEKGRFAVEMAIRQSPNYRLMRAAGLFLSDHASKTLLKSEEAYMSRLSSKAIKVGGVDINPLAASERAYTAFLDSLRASSFNAMVDKLGKTGTPTIGELKAIANYINVTTGRAKVGSEGIAKSLANMNGVFFAPRFVLSRFQTVALQPLRQKDMGRARKMIAQEYGRYFASLAVIYTLGVLAGGELESDTRSSDAGKIRFGNVRFDPMSGFSQTAVLLTRVGTGMANTLADINELDRPFEGNYKSEDGVEDRKAYEIALRFGRSKLGPVPGIIADWAMGSDFMGQELDRKYLLKQIIPLSLGDIQAAMEDQGVPAGTIFSTLGLFGEGLQVHDQRR